MAVDLSGIDFGGTLAPESDAPDLSQIDFSGIDFAGVDFEAGASDDNESSGSIDTSGITEYENPVARGFAAGLDQVQGLGGGATALVGDLVGSDGLRDWGLESYQRNMAEAGVNAPSQTFTEIDSASGALEWAGYTLGNLAPTMATSLLGGGIGGLAAKKGVKELAERLVKEQVAKGVALNKAKEIAGKEVAKRIAAGTLAGAGVASVGMSGGEIYGDTEDAGVALSHGLVAGAVDALPITRVLGKFGLGKTASDEIKKSILAEAGKQSLFEGGTEAFQTLVEQHAKHWVENNGESLLANLGETNWKEIADATAAGFLGGSVMGAPAQAVQNRAIAKRDAQQAKKQQIKKEVIDRGGSEIDAEIAVANYDLDTNDIDSFVDAELGLTEGALDQPASDPSFLDMEPSVQPQDGQIVPEPREPDFLDMEPAVAAPVDDAPRGLLGGVPNVPLLENLNRPGGVMQMPGPVRPDRTDATQQALEGSFPEYTPPERIAPRSIEPESTIPEQPESTIPETAPVAPIAVTKDSLVDDTDLSEKTRADVAGETPERAALIGARNLLDAWQDDYSIPPEVIDRVEGASKAIDDALAANGAGNIVELAATLREIANDADAEPDVANELRATAELLGRASQGNQGAGPRGLADSRGASEPASPTLTASGKPFKTERSALESARQKGIESAEAVPVEGGFGYVSEATVEESASVEDIADTEAAPQAEPITDDSLPEILRTPRKQYLRQMEKKQGIKRDSPGYKDAVARLESEYDAATDQALGNISFEQYQALNPDQPESVNRQAHAALVEEFGGAEPEADANTQEQQALGPESDSPARIEDFGETLEGARKHTAVKLGESLSDESIDVAAEPLSKSFPQPNYKKLSEEGIDGYSLALVAVLRDQIPTKPRRGYKLKRWAEDVEKKRKIAKEIIEQGDKFTGNWRMIDELSDVDIMATAEAIKDVPAADLPKAAKYKVASGEFSLANGVKHDPPKQLWFIKGPNDRRLNSNMGDIDFVESEAEAVAAAKKVIPKLIASESGSKPRSKYTEVGIYRDRSNKDIYIAFKVRSSVIRIKGGFDDPTSAREYINENRDEIQAKIDAMRKGPNMRGAENAPRQGDDLRDGDISPDDFTSAFGFRGVQFGNYVEGKRRQADLNRAYDALMDLADVAGIPPKAASLNGSLGLAFGARGKGGRNAAAAHYEPSTVVINLTKGGGPGSLAHEWLHALDNYFAKQDDADGFISERRRESGPVRDEVYQAWKQVEDAIGNSEFSARSKELDKARSKPYWDTTIEKAARAFEKYVIDRALSRGVVNDYLANIDTTSGAYPTDQEMQEAGIKDAFDSLFTTIESKETDKGVMLYSHADPQLESELGKTIFKRYADFGAEQVGIDQTLDDVEQVLGFRSPFDVVEDETLGPATPMAFDLETRVIKINPQVKSSRVLAAQYMAEEVMHGIDAVAPNRTISASSELFAKGGAIREEAQAQFDGGALSVFLSYPLDSKEFGHFTDSEIKAELFARLGVLYLGDPQLLREEMPNAYRAYNEIFGLEPDSPFGDSFVFRKVWGISTDSPGQVLRGHRAVQRIQDGAGGKSGGQRTSDGLAGIRRAVSGAIQGRRVGSRIQFSQRKSLLRTSAPAAPSNNGNTPPPDTPSDGGDGSDSGDRRNSYDQAYDSLGNKDKSIFERAKKAIKREVTPGGLLPEAVFKLKLNRDFKLNGFEFDIANRLGHFDAAVKDAYGEKYSRLDDAEKGKINALLAGEMNDAIPDPVREEVHKMRAVIRGISKAYALQLEGQIAELTAAGDPAALEKAALLETINNNLDTYVHRSYRAFDDPAWPKKVDKEVYDNAVRFLENQYADGGEITDEIRQKVIRKIKMILEDGTAYDSMESFISESKLGAKDLSVLQRRKQIAPEIRALLGEYTDPKINFTKSVTKMTRLVLNQRFLDRVKEVGMGDFLFTEETAPPEATKKIAGDASEVYAPLNGLYTFPEVDQALKDALGREQMADWFRTVVRLNGLVKYGKTVLSPTTAARNWMSAAFFAMGNGHFDITQMQKSVSGLREYFTHKGDEGKTAYLRKLKNLGVVYDTPYAGEMMDLLADSQLEKTLFDKGPMASVRKANEYAQKFYQYGDDFWKILGFENEKAMLMKHKGLGEAEAEKEAAERIRNTYPTYSLTGRFVRRLRRFPLAGTFVSFPAEIIRTSYHIVRYAAKDMKETPAMGARKIAGLAIASGMIHAVQAVSMALMGMDDDEEEAFRQLAAPWQRNSNLLTLGRDEEGNTRLLDMSFLDPYNYWKRPLNAALRGQPVDDLMKEVVREALSPFFGTDIAFQAIAEAATNQKSSGGRVFNPHAPVDGQIIDIGDHLRKALQPGILSNAERIIKASAGEVSASGKPYTLRDEMAALAGFRVTTFDPKASLYYKAFEFQDKKRNASSILSSVARNPNKVSDGKIRTAYGQAMDTRIEAYEEMITLVKAAMSSGLSRGDVVRALRNSGVSQRDAHALASGRVPRWKPPTQMMRNAVKKAEVLFDRDTAKEFRRREQVIRESFREASQR